MAERPPSHYERVVDRWDDVLSDLEKTAEEYRKEGWETVTIRAGEVTPLVEDDRPGLDVVVPDNEFTDLTDAVDNASFDAFDVYADRDGDLVFAVIVEQHVEDGVAVLYPVYYDVHEADDVFDLVREQDELWTFLRTLDESSRLELRHEPVDAFLP